MTSNFDTSDRNAQKGGDFVPRLAMINDIAGFGRCSTTVSLPVISVMKVQVCPVPTSVLSNHLGFPLCHFDDYTSHMRDYIKVWNELGLTFDGLYCGFLGNEEQIDIVRECSGRPCFCWIRSWETTAGPTPPSQRRMFRR